MSAAAIPVPADAEPKKGKKKLLVVLVAVFALLAAGGGGAAWHFHKKAADAEHGEEAKPKAEAKKPPVFTTLESFTVNLAGGEHFMQLGVVLQLKDEAAAEKIKAYLPLIRNHILLRLSSKTPEDLESPKGKQQMIEEILADTRGPLGADGEGVQAVLLGSMIVQ